MKEYIQTFLLAFTGSLCAGYLFNLKRLNLIWSGFSGMVGWVTYIVSGMFLNSSVFSIFCGAVAIGLYSEIMARKLKVPATILTIPGIFPLVPGIAAYESIQFILNNKLPEAAAKAVETFGGAGAIAFGIMLVTAFFKIKPGLYYHKN